MLLQFLFNFFIDIPFVIAWPKNTICPPVAITNYVATLPYVLIFEYRHLYHGDLLMIWYLIQIWVLKWILLRSHCIHFNLVWVLGRLEQPDALEFYVVCRRNADEAVGLLDDGVFANFEHFTLQAGDVSRHHSWSTFSSTICCSVRGRIARHIISRSRRYNICNIRRLIRFH